MTEAKRGLLLRLPHDETDERKRYSHPDPDELADAYAVVYRHHYYGERAPTREEMARVLVLAGGYLDLTTYGSAPDRSLGYGGQEHCVKHLREIWRARKARWER